MYSCEPLLIDKQRQEDLLESIYDSFMLIQDITWKTSWEQGTIETGGEKGSGRSMLAAQHDNDDEY